MDRYRMFKYVGAGMGVVTVVMMVNTAPFHVLALVVGAGLYFYGDKKLF